LIQKEKSLGLVAVITVKNQNRQRRKRIRGKLEFREVTRKRSELTLLFEMLAVFTLPDWGAGGKYTRPFSHRMAAPLLPVKKAGK